MLLVDQLLTARVWIKEVPSLADQSDVFSNANTTDRTSGICVRVE